MDNNLKTNIWIIVVVVVIVNIIIFGVYFQPRWNKVTNCLKEKAEEICHDNNMSFLSSDGYPHRGYSLQCQDYEYVFSREFTKQEVEDCKLN